MKITKSTLENLVALLANEFGIATSKEEAVERKEKTFAFLGGQRGGYFAALKNIETGGESRFLNLSYSPKPAKALHDDLSKAFELVHLLQNGLPVTPYRKLSKLDTITVVGRRWFDGCNTYHSCQVYVNGSWIGENKFTYGYGDAYLVTAYGILSEKGYLPEAPGYASIRANTYANVVFTVTDVKTKKEL